jgi:hypothetical protein
MASIKAFFASWFYLKRQSVASISSSKYTLDSKTRELTFRILFYKSGGTSFKNFNASIKTRFASSNPFNFI